MSTKMGAAASARTLEARPDSLLGWKVVVGAGFGISFGSLPFVATGFAILAGAMADEFRWTQSQVAGAATIFLGSQIFANWACSLLLKRWGSREVASASILMFAACLIGLSQINGSLLQYYFAFAMLGVLGIGTNPVAYAQPISRWFDRRRGLALGLASASQSVGLFVFPALLQVLIVNLGWRWSLASIAVFEVVVCLPIVVLLVREAPAESERIDAATIERRRPVRVLKNLDLWKLMVGFSAIGMTIYAVAPNIAYILKETAGLSISEVAKMQAMTGVSFLFGRVLFGLLLDSSPTRHIALLAVFLAAAYLAIFAFSSAPFAITAGFLIGGLANGGESDLMPYLAGRYFGAREVSRIYGILLSGFFLGAAAEPSAFAYLSRVYDGPETPLKLLILLQLLPAGIFLSLRPYPVETTSDG